jgi:hypothetical protein
VENKGKLILTSRYTKQNIGIPLRAVIIPKSMLLYKTVSSVTMSVYSSITA